MTQAENVLSAGSEEEQEQLVEEAQEEHATGQEHQPQAAPGSSTRMCRTAPTVNRALVLATGAAVLSIACAAVIAKSVCSWIWGSRKKQEADMKEASEQEAATAGQPQVRGGWARTHAHLKGCLAGSSLPDALSSTEQQTRAEAVAFAAPEPRQHCTHAHAGIPLPTLL